MLKLRRQAAVAHPRVACLLTSRRGIQRHHSPDRTFSQEIQDRQNTFQWSKKHIFRPHQHFSYDPSNWSRTLEEKALKHHSLSLVERVKLAQEHEAERTANLAAAPHRAEPSASPPQTSPATSDAGMTKEEEAGDEMPAYFFSLEDTTAAESTSPAASETSPWAAIPLQELLDELRRLDHRLHSRRYAGNALLSQRARQEDEFRELLFQLFERLRGAVLDVTVTTDACAFGWFTLLTHVEALTEAVMRAAAAAAAAPPSDAMGEEEAVEHIFLALHAGLLAHMAEGQMIYSSASTGELELEALMELLSIATAPFVRNCCAVFQKPALTAEEVQAYASWVATAAHHRARTAEEPTEEKSAVREWVDPAHVAAWANAVRHLHQRHEDVSAMLPGLLLYAEHAAVYVTRTLEGVTGMTMRGRVVASLQRTRHSPGVDAEGVREPKAVPLDVTAPPRGVQAAPTECDDAVQVLSAATALVLVTASTKSGDALASLIEEHVRRLATVCLRMTAQAPNYDLAGTCVVRWANALLDAGVLLSVVPQDGTSGSGGSAPARGQESVESTVRLSLRLLLLLSRQSFTDVADRPLIARLILLLTQLPEPAEATAAERAEWRRLRGLVMRAALDRVSCEDLEHAATTVEGVSSWMESLAFGEYDGAVPVNLWRAACASWLPEGNTPFIHNQTRSPPAAAAAAAAEGERTASAAHALLLLCARLIAREEEGRGAAVAVVNLHSLPTAQRVAACLAVYLGRPGLEKNLLRSVELWESIAAEFPEPLVPLLTAMRAIVQQFTSPSKVMQF